MSNRRVGRMCFPTLIAASLLMLPAAALGGKQSSATGPVEISQNDSTKGKKGGSVLFFPFVIESPGSYKLMSNLDLRIDPAPGPDTDAIQITADDVTLDLNGFQIIGAASCTGSPVTSCDPPGDTDPGSAIDACPAGECARNTSVKNGVIRGMAGPGIRLGDAAHVHGVRVEENVGGGIQVGADSEVTHSHAARNLLFGLSVSSGSRITSSSASGNGGEGANVGDTSVVWGSVFTGNTTGLMLGSNAGYHGNIISGNGNDVLFIGDKEPIELGQNLCGNSAACP